jgi:hypothetical protein
MHICLHSKLCDGIPWLIHRCLPADMGYKYVGLAQWDLSLTSGIEDEDWPGPAQLPGLSQLPA